MTTDFANVLVGVLSGGDSPEADGSVHSGREVAAALTGQGVATRIIDIGKPDLVVALAQIDYAFIACHGWYGEDGKLQGLLEMLEIPYTGPGVLSSALCMHKPTFKNVLEAKGIPTPRSWTSTPLDLPDDLPYPVFVKPASGGESFASGIARSPAELRSIVSRTGGFDVPEFVVEPYLGSTTYTVGVLEHNGSLCALPVLEIESPGGFYDYDSKMGNGDVRYHCPARLSAVTAERMTQLALRTFTAAGCRDVSRVDLMLDGDEPTVLEVNTVPGLRAGGNLATSAAQAGISYPELVMSILRGALRDRTYVP